MLQDTFSKQLRRTVMRYVNLSNILVLRQLSSIVEARFPTHQSLMDANLILSHEAKRLAKVEDKTPHESSWVPLLWAMKLIAKARKDKEVTIEPPAFTNLQTAFDNLETKNRTILNYSNVEFPLAYTQVTSKKYSAKKGFNCDMKMQIAGCHTDCFCLLWWSLVFKAVSPTHQRRGSQSSSKCNNH